MVGRTNNIAQFWRELKRRRVIHVIVVYATAAYVIIELINNVTTPLNLPDWTPTLFIVLLAAGFPLAIIFSWIFDVTPEGVRVTKSIDEQQAEITTRAPNSWRIATFFSLLIIVVLILFNVLRNLHRSRDIRKLEKTIAVLPFENWHSEDGYAHLGDAIANEINTQLAKVKDFHVFAYTSCARFKGPDKPAVSQIGRALGANFIIEGSVERQDQDVSIHIQVINATRDVHIWAREFKGKWKDLFKIRAEIAVKIAEELETILSPEEIEDIEKKPTISAEAYHFFLLGQYLIGQNVEESLREAVHCFEYAIRLDPNYAEAYAGLAECYQFMVRYNYLTREEGNMKAKQVIRKAIDLDPGLGEAYAILGLIMVTIDWDLYGADQQFREAIRLSPKNAEVHAKYAQYLRWLGRYDRAMEMAKRASELDPLTPLTNFWLGAIYSFAGRYDESIDQCHHILELDSSYFHAYAYLAYNYSLKGSYSKAVFFADKALSFDEVRNDRMYLPPVIWVYAKSGETGRARELLSEFQKLCENTPCDPISYTLIYTGLGDYEKAFEYLKAGYEQRSGLTLYLLVNGNFLLKEISSDPRYIEILRKLGFKMNE